MGKCWVCGKKTNYDDLRVIHKDTTCGVCSWCFQDIRWNSKDSMTDEDRKLLWNLTEEFGMLGHYAETVRKGNYYIVMVAGELIPTFSGRNIVVSKIGHKSISNLRLIKKLEEFKHKEQWKNAEELKKMLNGQGVCLEFPNESLKEMSERMMFSFR